MDIILYNDMEKSIYLGRFRSVKNKTFLSSVRCAFNGLFTALESEKNYKIYLCNILLTLPLNIMLGFSWVEFIIYGVCIVGVFSAECFNTAIEKICDFLTQEKDDRIKVIKDIAAAGVLCWGGAFYVSEAIMIALHVVPW